MARLRELGATNVEAVVGPSVCPRCYEVPEAMRDEAAAVEPTSASVTWTGTPALDVAAGVVAQLAREGKLADFYERLEPLLDFLVPEYEEEGKAHLLVAIGCTGGRHRSVAIVEHLAARFRDTGGDGVVVEVEHRDVDRRVGNIG